MMIFKKAIPRRTFLYGMGSALALPVLDAMFPAFASAAEKPKSPLRVAWISSPNGRIMENWTPEGEGTDFTFSPTLEPFAPFKNDIIIMSELNIKAADAREGEPGGNHGRPCGAYLTGFHPKPGGAVTVSADQMIAKNTSKFTQLGSMQLAIDSADLIGVADGAYTDAQQKTLSWSTPTTPLPTENNPRKVFERMLGESDTTDPAERLARIKRNRSILDSMAGEMSSLMTGLGPSDRGKLDEYFTALRDIERRIHLAEEQSSREMPEMERPAGIPASFMEHASLMFDLMILAFQSDMTRVITFMFGREQTTRSFAEIGVRDGWHPLSHHGGNTDAIEQLKQIDLYHSKAFAYFLEKMKATKDGDGTLLDHAALVYGATLSDGNHHLHYDVPTILAGGANGQIKGGRHIRYAGAPLSNLHITMMEMAGTDWKNWVDPKESDGCCPLDQISA
jgi:hypothetical protein